MSRYASLAASFDPFVLDVIDREEPHAGAGQVRVRVRAAGLNPVDWKIAASPATAERFGVVFPTGFGNDFAGEIDEVGDGVEGFSIGDRVFGGRRGDAVSEHTVITVDSGTIVRTPDGVDDVTAATLDIAGRTASAALAKVGLTAGDTVLIGGAAGGVGVFAVQLAVAAGAVVVATASEENHDFLRGLGATPTTYGEGLAERVRALAHEGVDAAIDLQGTETVLAALELGVAPTRIATIAAGPTPPGGAQATGGIEAAVGALEQVAADVADGSIRVPIQETFPLERVNDAVALLRTGHVRGKIVVTI